MKKETCYICGDEVQTPIRQDGQVFCCETCAEMWGELWEMHEDVFDTPNPICSHAPVELRA